MTPSGPGRETETQHAIHDTCTQVTLKLKCPKWDLQLERPLVEAAWGTVKSQLSQFHWCGRAVPLHCLAGLDRLVSCCILRPQSEVTGPGAGDDAGGRSGMQSGISSLHWV